LSAVKDDPGAPRRPSAFDWDGSIRAYNARVVASLLALKIPFERAEELTSQAWTRLIEQDRDGRLPEIKMPGLAIKQARFLALTWLKHHRREAELPEDIVSGLADPERALIARRDVEIALRVLAGSSRSAQAVFAAIYEDPPPPHEVVAARVGLSLQRVRQILCEVRKKIREALEAKS
jgi:DNA-directed RNA polymerase specialized sigma24 family protein